jgi:hypothetical protein
VRLTVRAILAIEKHIVADVVCEVRAALRHGERQLLEITQPGSLQLDDVLCVEVASSKRLRKQQVDVFVEEQADLRHQ